MPHLTASEHIASPSLLQEDCVIPDVPPQALWELIRDGEVDEVDNTSAQPEENTGKLPRVDIKLEDLFDEDDDEDDEFPGSSVTEGKIENSPPAESLYRSYNVTLKLDH